MLNYLAVLTVLVTAILALEYHIFYTKLHLNYYGYMILGITMSVANLIQDQYIFTWLYVAFAIIECIRIFLMALIHYPSAISELKELNEDLEKRVEQRTQELSRTNQKLTQANAELQQLDQMKTAFVSQASHDLRTPLTAIKGSLDNLSIGIAGELTEKQLRILKRAIRSVDRLTDLINDILDLNRIESGRVVLEKRDFSLRESVASLVQENRPAAEQKGIQLKFEKPDDSCFVHADPGKIERVIGELIGNAVKYTKENGSVMVYMKKEMNVVTLSVQDNGVGLSPEACKKIWERFYRVPETQHAAKGSGLGLSIAKEVIGMHGGTISVSSELGKGTTFTVQLQAGQSQTG
jgi:signal transduction histidine kinase